MSAYHKLVRHSFWHRGANLARRDIPGIPLVSTAETLEALEGGVDVWCLFHNELGPHTPAHWMASLTAEEHERGHHLRSEYHRRVFVATRALVRAVLSAYAAVPPGDWSFVAGEQGKPRIRSPDLNPELHFNLTHTAGLIACAVSTAYAEVGVDAESLDQAADLDGVAGRFFSRDEVAALRSAAPCERHAHLLSGWTLKESYAKARGIGLRLPLNRLSFLFGGSTPDICTTFHPGLDDDPAEWSFSLLNVARNQVVAVAARTRGSPLRLRAAECLLV